MSNVMMKLMDENKDDIRLSGNEMDETGYPFVSSFILLKNYSWYYCPLNVIRL